MAKMTVYHGGYTPIEIPEICIGKTTKDFEVDFIIDCRNGKKHAYDIVISNGR